MCVAAENNEKFIKTSYFEVDPLSRRRCRSISLNRISLNRISPNLISPNRSPSWVYCRAPTEIELGLGLGLGLKLGLG